MTERPSLPTLLVETVGEVLAEMLADATREAAAFFADVPFRCMSFDARQKDRVDAYGGTPQYVLYEANVLFMATGVLPGATPTDAATMDGEPDDDAEVRIP
jgi:hypothetical protein